jgi:stage II sporulation protein AA (anti-sigma F factor antagonist)
MEPVESKLKVEHAMGTTFVTLQETHILEENQIKELEESIMPSVEKVSSEKLVLNFADVQFMSSSFLGLLAKIHKRVSEQGGNLALCKVDPSIYKVFEITNLTKVFQIL